MIAVDRGKGRFSPHWYGWLYQGQIGSEVKQQRYLYNHHKKVHVALCDMLYAFKKEAGSKQVGKGTGKGIKLGTGLRTFWDKQGFPYCRSKTGPHPTLHCYYCHWYHITRAFLSSLCPEEHARVCRVFPKDSKSSVNEGRWNEHW